MLKFLFYSFGMIVLLYEWWAIKNFGKIKEFNTKIGETNKKQVKDMTSDEKAYVFKGCILVVFMMLYYLWVGVGLFTVQWPLFLLILIMSFVSQSKIMKDSSSWNTIDSVITIILVIFMMVNAAQLKIDVADAIMKFFLG